MLKLILGLSTIAIVIVAALFYMVSKPPQTEVLSGTVRYNERMALPPGSMLKVELRDVTNGDAPTTVSSYEHVTAGENVPLPFSLTYDTNALSEGKQYALFADILIEGQIRFANEASYPITSDREFDGVDVLLAFRENTDEGALPLEGEGKKAPSPSPLAGTAWIWKETAHDGKRTVPEGDDFVISFTETEVQSSTDCNSLGGTYIVADSNITFSPLAMTEMYCEGSLDTVYANDLSKALQFNVEGTALTINIGSASQMRFMKTTYPVAQPPSDVSPDTPVSSDEVETVEIDAAADAAIDSVDQ